MQVSTPRSRTGGRWLRQGGGVAAVVAGGALLLGACGGSGSPSTNTTATSVTLPGGSTTPTIPGGSTTPTTAGGGGGVSSIASALQSGETTAFDAKYTITGSSDGMSSFEDIVQPPSSFTYKVDSSSGLEEIIDNGKNAYSCKPQGSSWQCQEFPTSYVSELGAVGQAYTGKYWYNDVAALQAESSVAGFHETTSTMSVGGQNLNCVTWTGGSSGVTSGEVCVTSAGVLGYVKSVSGGKTSTFALTSYSTSVPASDFAPPSGATITTIPAGA